MAAPSSFNVDGSRSDVVVVDAGQLAAALGEPAAGGGAAAGAVSMVPRALGAIGFLTGAMGVATAVYKQPGGELAGHELAYYLGLGGVFAAGVADVWAALWVSGDVRARRGVGKAILCAACVPLLVALGLGGYGLQLK